MVEKKGSQVQKKGVLAPFADVFEQFDAELHGDGVPVDQVARQRVAPCIDRETYVNTLAAINKVEVVDGKVRYKRGN
ncbi:hypothetical protein JXA63_05275 [Candidatus Woesebacteria bacterium]|nr:hypothetical protein [Candidatus Woesebacteria bacterium]